MFRKYKSQSSKLEVMVCKWKWLVQVRSLLQTLDTNKANSQSQCPQFDRHEILFGPQAAGWGLLWSLRHTHRLGHRGAELISGN